MGKAKKPSAAPIKLLSEKKLNNMDDKRKNELEEMASTIVGYSEGAYNLGTEEDFDKLSDKEKAYVLELVYAEIDNCNTCGWWWTKDSLDENNDCWQCAELNEDLEDEDRIE